MKLIAGYIGKAKDFKPIFAKKEDLPEPPGKVETNNFDIYILPEREVECKCK
jgi:hypothetical protein